jgi:hypothetical protein
MVPSESIFTVEEESKLGKLTDVVETAQSSGLAGGLGGAMAVPAVKNKTYAATIIPAIVFIALPPNLLIRF